MTASELVDLATDEASAASPGDVWLADRSWTRPRWTVDELVAAKAGRTVSVVLPALDEEDTVGSVIETISPLVGGLVDELIVLDSGSTDDTEIRAIAAGARVVTREQALPDVAPRAGKGEVLWRSLAATSGDFVVFVDSDLIDPHPMFVPRLLGPLLTRDGIHLVKSFYRRPLNVRDAGGPEGATGGGRVTELVARPLLAALRPELGGVLQPLGGEYAATRELLTSLPFAPGYGVEIGLLVDTYDRLGLDAIAQVNLGVRAHRNRPLAELGPMSRQVVATLLSRCGVPDSGAGLTQFFVDGDGYTPRTSAVSLADRPPMNTVPIASAAQPGAAGRPPTNTVPIASAAQPGAAGRPPTNTVPIASAAQPGAAGRPPADTVPIASAAQPGAAGRPPKNTCAVLSEP